eukprot:UN16339
MVITKVLSQLSVHLLESVRTACANMLLVNVVKFFNLPLMKFLRCERRFRHNNHFSKDSNNYSDKTSFLR